MAFFHWHNENEGRTDSSGHTPKGFPYHGQAWLHLTDRLVLSTEWSLWSKFCGLSFRLKQGEPELQVHAALPPVALWFSIETPWVYKLGELLKIGHENREITFSIYEWTARWVFWKDDDSWSRGTSRWRQGHLNLPDFFFGDLKFERRILKQENVSIPMPEKNYPAVVTLDEATWKRPRWPFTKRRLGADVKLTKPIPTPGKGENSWDCGEDAIYQLSCGADSIAEAIGKTVASAMESRFRHGGRNWQPERKPDDIPQIG